jgi:hypothetical protein
MALMSIGQSSSLLDGPCRSRPAMLMVVDIVEELSTWWKKADMQNLVRSGAGLRGDSLAHTGGKNSDS